MKKYYTIAVKDAGVWGPQFGGYNRADVVQEIEDSFSEIRNCDIKVICTSDKQDAIDARIAQMNAGA